MGGPFSRQMMFDGLYSAVTVICSKTDDIRVQEAISNMRLSESLTRDVEKLGSLNDEIQFLETKIRDLKREKKRLRAEFRKADDDLNAFDTALERIQSGDTAEESLSELGKRKFTAAGLVDASELATEEQVESHVNTLRDATRRLDKKIKLLGEEVEQEEDVELASLQDQKTELTASVKESCIKERNASSTVSIQRRFADCIRE